MLAVVVLGSVVDVLVARHLHHGLDKTLRTRAVEVAQLAASAPALVTQPGALDAPGRVDAGDGRGRRSPRPHRVAVALARRTRAAAVDRGAGDLERPRELRHRRVRRRAASGLLGSARRCCRRRSGARRSVDGRRRRHGSHAARADSGRRARGGSDRRCSCRAPDARRAATARASRSRGSARSAAAAMPGAGCPTRTGEDEVGRLATTLNTMLEGLERARDAERRFLADASHELRTPLTALRGNVAHLARHGATPALVADLEADAERLAQLADDLLALSREEAAPPPAEDLSLDDLARAVAAEGVTVHAEPVVVRGDRAALERALGNLIENARRHGRGAVTVTVAASRRSRPAQRRGRGAGHSRGRPGAGVRAVLRPRLRARAGDRPGHGRAPRRPRLRRRFARDDRARQESIRVRRRSCPARSSRKDRREDLPHAANIPLDRPARGDRRRARRRASSPLQLAEAAARRRRRSRSPRRSTTRSAQPSRQASRRGSPSRTSCFPPAR